MFSTLPLPLFFLRLSSLLLLLLGRYLSSRFVPAASSSPLIPTFRDYPLSLFFVLR